MDSDSEGSTSGKSSRDSGDGMYLGSSTLDTEYVYEEVSSCAHATECECCDDTSDGDYPDSFSSDGSDKSNDESEDISSSYK